MERTIYEHAGGAASPRVSPGSSRAAAASWIGRGSLVASFDDHEAAQDAIDWLAHERFPVAELAIEAEGVRVIERIGGRVTAVQSILVGALPGALIGGLIGLPFGATMLLGPGLILGACAGAGVGLGCHAALRPRRFSRTIRLESGSYRLRSAPAVAGEAARLVTLWAHSARSPASARAHVPRSLGDSRET